jgi:tetratricopeptide (TPR) repeat protein
MSYAKRWYWDKVATWAIILRKNEIAYEYWHKMLADKPDDPYVLSMIAHQKALENKDAEAIKTYEKVLALSPNDAAATFNYAFLVQKVGDHDNAVKAFKRALEADPKLDRAWFGQGLSHAAKGEDEEAIACFKKTNSLQPMSPHGYYELAKAQHRQNDLNACEKTMRKVKGFDPKVAAQLEDETGIQIGVERWWANRR